MKLRAANPDLLKLPVNSDRLSWRWTILGALGIYCLFGLLLLAQKPGLEYDEALLVSGAVHLRHNATAFSLDRPLHSWVCAFHHCIPLMTALYVGAVKEYLCFPLFVAFGPRTSIIRLVSLLLSVVGIWGLSKLVAEQVSRPAAAAVALILAINPSYANMAVFDNTAFGPMMAALGLVCAGLAYYLRRRRLGAAFWFGAAMGFGVWTRANFVWILAAGAGAALIAFRRRLRMPAAHCAAVAAGGIVGGFPFLLYQALSGLATWHGEQFFVAPYPLRKLLPYRLWLLGDTLLSDGEHREMWGTTLLPHWQLWLFPIAVAAACLLCLAIGRYKGGRRWDLAQFAALALLFFAAFLFFSRLQVAEHHIVALIPFAAVVVVLACLILQARYRRAWVLSAGLALIYAGSAFYWQFAAIQGLRRTRGLGIWSNADQKLVRFIENHYPHRQIKILDWGLEENLYVLTDGRLRSRSIFLPGSANLTYERRPWIEEIRKGGVFLLNGPHNRQWPKPSAGFLQVLAEAKPAMRRYNIAQRDGATYAEIIEIQPNSVGRAASQMGSQPFQ